MTIRISDSTVLRLKINTTKPVDSKTANWSYLVEFFAEMSLILSFVSPPPFSFSSSSLIYDVLRPLLTFRVLTRRTSPRNHRFTTPKNSFKDCSRFDPRWRSQLESVSFPASSTSLRWTYQCRSTKRLRRRNLARSSSLRTGQGHGVVGDLPTIVHHEYVQASYLSARPWLTISHDRVSLTCRRSRSIHSTWIR